MPRNHPRTKTPSATVRRADILVAANAVIGGDRQEKYGDVVDNFSRIARLWSVILGFTITAEDVAPMMVAVKLSRLVTSPGHVDNWVDIAGYAALGGEVATMNVAHTPAPESE